MIDIIIPVYNSLNIIEKTLMSLSFQTIVDKLNIVIVDDCSNDDYKDILKKYDKLLNIKYIKNDINVGAGLSRQKGIENSDSEYIMFIDSDDLLYSFDSIEKLYDSIKDNYEYVYSMCFDESINNTYINDGDLHGKMYSRKFITDNNIKFNSSRYHEDNAFNNIVLINNPKKIKNNSITYIYCNNDESLTKKDKEKEFDRLKIYIENIKYVLECTQNCNKYFIDNYLKNKYNYLNNYSKNLSVEKKEQINKWLEENNLYLIA